ncbi:MAG: class I SAM-dependent methyltransferase [Nanoarchaeota archaeon]
MGIVKELTIEEKVRNYFDSQGYVYYNLEQSRVLLEQNPNSERTFQMLESGGDFKTLEDIRSHYNLIAPTHYLITAPLRPLKEKLLSFLYNVVNEHNPDVVVDAGCGVGLQVCFLARAFPERRFIGYDLSYGMIVEAEKRRQRLGLENVELWIAPHEKFNPQTRPNFIYTQESLSQFNFGSIEEAKQVNVALGNFSNLLPRGGLYALLFTDYLSDDARHFIRNFTHEFGFEKFMDHSEGVEIESEILYPTMLLYQKVN